MTKLFYRRPTAVRRHFYDPLMRTLILRWGFGGFLDRGGSDTVQVLAVHGRRTGATHQHPVGISVLNGHRYVIGFYGQTQWSRNLRVCPDAQLRSRGRRDDVTAIEVTDVEKEAFLRALVDRYRFFARAWLKVAPQRLSADDMRRLLNDYPVFRLEPADGA